MNKLLLVFLFLLPSVTFAQAPGGPLPVQGPVTSTDNALPRFDGTNGKTIQNSGVIVSDGNVLTGASLSGASNTFSNINWNVLVSTPTTLSGYGITDAQPLDSDLTAIAALTTDSFGRGLLPLTTAGAVRTYIDAQQLDSDLTAIAGLTTDSFGRGLLPLTTSGAVRTYIGAGTSSFSGSFNDLTDKPTTLAGYGITDALSNSDSSTQTGAFGDIKLQDDSTPSHYLTVTAGSNLTDNRTLTIFTGDSSRSLTLSGDTTLSGTNTGDQTITLTGDVTGSGTGSFAVTLSDSDLTAIAALTTTSFGRSVLTLADAAALRNLGGASSGIWTVPQGGSGVGTITGLIKGNGTSPYSAATAGTDYVQPGVILIQHDDNTTTTYATAADTDSARGDILRTAFAALADFDHLIIGPGTYAIGDNVLNAATGITDVTLSGAGSRTTYITSTANLNTKGCILNPGTRWTIKDLAIDGTLTNGTFQACVGCGADGTGQTGYTDLRVTNVYLHADSDGIFCGGSTAIVGQRYRDCLIETKYDAVRHNETSSQTLTEIVDGILLVTGPSTTSSARSRGVAVESGTVRMFSGRMSVTNGGATENKGALVDGENGIIELYDVLIATSNGANPNADLGNQIGGTLRVVGGRGSGTNGAYTVVGSTSKAGAGQTLAEILSVDGSGSGLDADTLRATTPTATGLAAVAATDAAALRDAAGATAGVFAASVLPNSAADGTTKGVASFVANDFDASSGNVGIDYTNGTAASGSTKGFLTAADWTTFNNKQAGDADLTVIAGLADPNADRILFWDDSAGAYAYLTTGSGLSISDTTITATGLGGDFVGPGSATDTALVLFDGTTGKLGKNSVATLSATGTFLLNDPASTAEFKHEFKPMFGGVDNESVLSGVGVGGSVFYIEGVGLNIVGAGATPDPQVGLYDTNGNGVYFSLTSDELSILVSGNWHVRDDLVSNASHTTSKGLILNGWGTTTGIRGGFTQWNYAAADTLGGYTFVNNAGEFVWDSSAQASAGDTGNARINFSTGAAVFGATTVTSINGKTPSTTTRVSSTVNATDTTLTNVTGLTFTATSGETYLFRAVLFVDADAAGGSKYAIAGTATASSVIYRITLNDDSTHAETIGSRETAMAGDAGQSGTTAGTCIIEGSLVCSGNGTITVQFAQNVDTGTSSVLTGSTFTVDEI